MRRDHTTTPFDLQAEEADDVTREFWGTSRGWAQRDRQTGEYVVDGARSAHAGRQFGNDDTTGSLRALRDGVRALRPQRVARNITGQVERTRQHRVVGADPHADPHADHHRADTDYRADITVADLHASAPRRVAAGTATLGQLASGLFDSAATTGRQLEPTAPHAVQRRPRSDDRDLVPLSPVQPLADRLGLSAVDPLLLRIGTLILVAVMLVPLALALRPTADGVIEAAPAIGAGVDAVAATTAPDLVAAARAAGVIGSDAVDGLSGQQSSGSGSSAAATTLGSTEAAAAATPSTAQSTDQQVATSGSGVVPDAAVGDVTQDLGSSGVQVASVSATAERRQPECPSTYVAGPGDSWYRIADQADVTVRALLDQNLASLDSVIFSGDDICLPEGATMPTQPVVTTQAPVTTSPTPATTAPPTTQPAPPPAPASTSEVQQMIREIWPDELEERALQIAWRESNYQPGVYNGWCCYGVFQIYWTVHRSWLDDYGITSSNDLLDARSNIQAAYALYQRAGGFGPWGG